MSGNSAFDQIEWPENPVLNAESWWDRSVEQPVWDRNVEVIKILCEIGEVMEWHDIHSQSLNTYTYMPYRYDVEGLDIIFLPHWDYYFVGGLPFEPLTIEADILRTVQLVKELANFGLKRELNFKETS